MHASTHTHANAHKHKHKQMITTYANFCKYLRSKKKGCPHTEINALRSTMEVLYLWFCMGRKIKHTYLILKKVVSIIILMYKKVYVG
mmetsp:Transcript_444/g.722  ORF Transcript_444/g.722 Transcript_444/m.722 type:complete len:87 (+) Transcript_444:92-352(+)